MAILTRLVMDMTRSTHLVMLIKNIYTLWGHQEYIYFIGSEINSASDPDQDIYTL